MGDLGRLEAEAAQFTEQLNELVSEVFLGKQHKFFYLVIDSKSPKISIDIKDFSGLEAKPSWLEMKTQGEDPITLRVSVSFACTWSREKEFLAIENSEFALRMKMRDEPLIRYDYQKSMHSKGLPSAHIQIHAHQELLSWLLIHAQKGRPAARWSDTKKPLVSQIHFPVGGDRFRPCLEDFLQFVITEFGIETKPGAVDALEKGRAQWRRTQLKAAVGDAPEIAAEVLRGLGYEVTNQDGASSGERLDKLTKL